ncbi:YciI family protein [Pseudonocardia sp.]|uniref:YciI family protein n=1 Tax=Pseudonocardia sp. TaxID=60912 RepID=UPI003D142F25
MHYLVLLYGDEKTAAEPGTPEFDAELAAYTAFDEAAAGAIRGGAALHLTERARTIRHDGAAVTITDGPFAETTEALGGYYVLEADDLDAVIALARRIPATTATHGGSEIRPMVASETLRSEGEMLPDLWLATLHRPGGTAGTVATGWGDTDADHAAFVEAHRDRLVRIAVVHPTTSATTVRTREGELVVTDGPYDPDVAVAGGFYVVQGTPEEAEALARAIPLPDGGAVELRPIVNLADLGM